jgi:hypothetical protein
VRITVASSARFLANRQVRSVRNTIRSRFSIVAPQAVPLSDSRHKRQAAYAARVFYCTQASLLTAFIKGAHDRGIHCLL